MPDRLASASGSDANLSHNPYATKKSHDEIEITPAMIEAGVAELSTYNLDYETREQAAVRIFEAMWNASKGQ